MGRLSPVRCWLGCAIGLLCMAAGHAQAVEATSFEQAVETALASNPKVLTAKAMLAATREKYEQSLGALLPGISVNASYTRVSDTWIDTSNAQNPERFNVNLVQPLYRQPLLLALKQTKPLIAAAEADYNAALQSVLLDTVQAMVTVLLTENVEKLAEDNLVLTHRNLDAAMARRQAGDMTRTDLDQATARVASSEAELIRAKNDAMVARARFEETVGMTVPPGLHIPDVPPHWLQGTLPDLSAQRRHRPDLQSAEKRLEAADVAVEMEKAGHFPFIDLQANSVTFQGGRGAAAQYNGENEYSIAVQLTLPIYAGGQTASKIREALDNRDTREAERQRVEKQALREINQAYLTMYSAKATVASSEVALQFYNQAVKGLEEEFAAGFRTVTQLFELQNQLFRSRTDLVKSRYELISAQYQLLQTIGYLTVADLQFPGSQSVDPADGLAVDTAGSDLFTRFIDSLKKLPPTDWTPTSARASVDARQDPLESSHGGQSAAATPWGLQWTRTLHVPVASSAVAAPGWPVQEVELPGSGPTLALTRRMLSRGP
ncbi:MAG: TolC family outer membrane protein [Magnetococcales bacterium]|nr:TolC family outer membrane protein [Magnetococcales bacterium]